MPNAYDTDFVAWAQQQAALLTERRFGDLDLDNLIEEVEDLANRHRDAQASQLRRALTHLLKLAYTLGSREPQSDWRRSVRDARDEIWDQIEEHPSLAGFLPGQLAVAYRRARREAHKQLTDYGDTHAPFPESCPWTLAQVLQSNLDGPCPFFQDAGEAKQKRISTFGARLGMDRDHTDIGTWEAAMDGDRTGDKLPPSLEVHNDDDAGEAQSPETTP